MSTSRSLTTLPDVVLREILAYLLVDTPREPNRAAILETCSTLHELGLPLLYRVVDIVTATVEGYWYDGRIIASREHSSEIRAACSQREAASRVWARMCARSASVTKIIRTGQCGSRIVSRYPFCVRTVIGL
jgi:hypothetical protein